MFAHSCFDCWLLPIHVCDCWPMVIAVLVGFALCWLLIFWQLCWVYDIFKGNFGGCMIFFKVFIRSLLLPKLFVFIDLCFRVLNFSILFFR